MSAFLKQCAVGVTAILLVAGCSQSATKSAVGSQPAPAIKPAEPPQIVAAKTAFYPMYTAAHNWAADVVLLRITAKQVPGFKNEGGKAAMWEAAFGSPSQREYRVYSYAIVSAEPYISKGVSAGIKIPWAGITRDAMPVDLSLFNIDSDAAYSTAAGSAASWLKKNPGKQLSSLEVGSTFKLQGPAWVVKWGDKQDGYALLIDANSGKVLKRS